MNHISNLAKTLRDARRRTRSRRTRSGAVDGENALLYWVMGTGKENLRVPEFIMEVEGATLFGAGHSIHVTVSVSGSVLVDG